MRKQQENIFYLILYKKDIKEPIVKRLVDYTEKRVIEIYQSLTSKNNLDKVEVIYIINLDQSSQVLKGTGNMISRDYHLDYDIKDKAKIDSALWHFYTTEDIKFESNVLRSRYQERSSKWNINLDISSMKSNLDYPIIEDAITILKNETGILEYNDKKYFEDRLKTEKYFNASYSQCHHRNELYFAENSILLRNSGNVVAVWDDKQKLGYIYPVNLINKKEALKDPFTVIKEKFDKFYYTENSGQDYIETNQVKAEYYPLDFGRPSIYAATLTWEKAEQVFKNSLTKDQLDLIEFKYDVEEYADFEQHDTEKNFTSLTVKLK